MLQRLVRLFLLALLVLASESGVWCSSLVSETWEAANLGPLASPWALNSSNTTTSASIVQGYITNTTRVLKFSDTNADTSNNHVVRTYTQISSGIVTLQFDICFPNNHAGYGMRITNGGTPTSGGNWLAAIKFEGDVPYAPGAAFGDISYQELTTGTNVYTRTNPVATYAADTWYTVQIRAYLDGKIYDIFFGPQGGILTRITPSSGVAFIKGTGGSQASTAGGLSFFSSQKLDASGSAYIDNISVTSGIEQLGAIADAKTVPSESRVSLVDQIITAGTDQMKAPSFFYIQDGTAGIRVRSSTVVRQGDKVTVHGMVQRASDGGVRTLRNGEWEINASSVSMTYGPFAMPAPAPISNRAIGGGPSTAIDTDGYPCQPGVWASSNGATSGYDQISETGPNNVGQLGQFSGAVVYADDANRFLYINDGSSVHDGSALADGSSSPPGVRVLVPPGVPLTGIVGKYAFITGVVGSVAQSDAGSPAGPGGNYIRNIRVIRPTCEPFLDLNLNGYWDPGEPALDTNANNAYDGIRISGVASPGYASGFDRYGTAIVRGQPFVPKGIYIYDLADPTLDIMVDQGFNTIINFDSMVPGDMATLNAHGLKTLPCLRDVNARPSWMAVKNDTAIAGWYVHDEPEGYSVLPAQALTDYQWVKAQDPGHLAGCSHFLYNAFNDYKASEEFTLSDAYPVLDPASSLMPIVDIMWYIHAVHGSVYYPGWQFVQLFQGGSQILPTPAQVRAMTYAALAFYAKGILYFSYQHPDNPLWPDDWAEVKKLNGELDLFNPFLTLPWTPLDASTSTDYVRIGGHRVGNSALIFTVNVTANPVTATFTLPGIPASSLTLPLESGATQPLVNRSFTYTYQPYQVRVLLWGSIPTATSPATASYSTTSGFVTPGWNLVSVPADPVTPDPLAVFSAIDVPNASFQFWKKNADGGGSQFYGADWGWTGPVVRGVPYWFHDMASGKIIQFVGMPPVTDFEITIPARGNAPFWVMFGTPFPDPVMADSVRFKNVSKRGDVWLTWEQAYSEDDLSKQIVESNAQGWSASDSGFISVTPTTWMGRHQLDPWWGYWIMLHDAGELKIKFPKP